MEISNKSTLSGRKFDYYLKFICVPTIGSTKDTDIGVHKCNYCIYEIIRHLLNY